MPTAHTFLVIDDNADSRFLLVKTLQRKFPSAVVQECHAAERALQLATREALTAIVTHRTTEMAGLGILRKLRETNATVPIVMVSSIDRREAALAAGATAFLLYDEWLRIGTLVGTLINPAAEPDAEGARPPEPAGA